MSPRRRKKHRGEGRECEASRKTQVQLRSGKEEKFRKGRTCRVEAGREGLEATASSAKHTWQAVVTIILVVIIVSVITIFMMTVITKRTYKKEARHSTQTPLQKSMLLSSVERSDRAPPDFASLVKHDDHDGPALLLVMVLVELQNTCKKKLNRKMLEIPNICYIF